MMRHHLHMPSYFLGTFTEYPLGKIHSEVYLLHRKKEIKTNRVLFLFLFDDSLNSFLYRCQTEL